MTTALAYAAAVSAIIVVVLAVVRDVPILHTLLPRDTPAGRWAPFIVLPAAVHLCAVGQVGGASLFGLRLHLIGQAMTLAYLWWCAIWQLGRKATP